MRSLDDKNIIIADKDDYEYVYDKEHKHKPMGGGWEKTEGGWSKGEKKVPDKENKGNEKNEEKEIKKNKPESKVFTIKINGNAENVKYEDMKTVEEQANFLSQVKYRDLHNDSELDYSKADLVTFKKNMDVVLSTFGGSKKLRSYGVGKKFSELKGQKEYAEELKENCFESMSEVFTKYSSTVLEKDSNKTLYEFMDVVQKTVSEAIENGDMDDVNDTDLYSYLQEDMKRLIYQEAETRRRSLGDHGIRHIAGNALHANDMLNQLNKSGQKISAKQRLMVISTMVNHDIGYCVGEPATDGMKGKLHKQYSGNLAREEKDRYNSVFGKDHEIMIGDGKENPGLIQNHDKSDYDWDKDPIGSAIAFADVTSLFGKDKLPELFYKKDDAMEAIASFQIVMTSADFSEEDREKCFNGFKKKMFAKIAELKTPLDNKLMLADQIREVTNSFTVRDVLSRASGELTGYEFNKEKKLMTANTEYSADGELLDLFFGDQIANYQWDKFTGDIAGRGYLAQKSGDDLSIEFGSVDGSKVAVVNKKYFEAPAKNTGVQSVFKNFKSYPVKQTMAKLSKKIVVPEGADSNDERVNKAKQKEAERVKSVERLKKTLETETNDASGKKSVGEMIFGAAWERVKELFADMKEGKDISDELKRLTGADVGKREELLSYFGIKTSMIWIKNAALKVIAGEYARFIDVLSKKIVRSCD